MSLRYRWNRVATSLITLGFCFGCANPLQRSNAKSNKPLSPDDCLIRNQAKRDANTIEFEVDFIKEITNKSSTISQSQPIQYVFEGEPNQVLYIEPTVYTTEQKICLNILASGVQPIYSGVLQNLQIPLRTKGKYALDLSILQGATSYDLTLRLEKSIAKSNLNSSTSRPSTKFPAKPPLNSTPYRDVFWRKSPLEGRAYNVSRKPPINYYNGYDDPDLKSIIGKVLDYQIKKGKRLSSHNISITLINMETQEFAHHKGKERRFPASIVKMFWMVIFYDLMNAGILGETVDIENNLEKMIDESDNTAASEIFDLISNAPSNAESKAFNYKNWEENRFKMNAFFQDADYKKIYISQKTFPFTGEGEYGNFPKGYEKDIRKNVPIRNAISTEHAARLMYEIMTGQAVSPTFSQEMRKLLKRDLSNSAEWYRRNPQMEFNPVIRFFGQYLPENVALYSKAGWTSKTRQEVAYIEWENTQYILAIFLDNSPDLAQNLTLFPELSCIIFEEMTERKCDRTRYTTK